MAPDTKVKETKATDAGALLDAGDGAVVTLAAGDTQLAAHRAVLAARSPVFDAMFRHDTLEASSGRVTITDVEGPVLRQLLAYCYTLEDLQPPSMALQLLVAADKYGLVGLKTRCEQQAAANLAVENAAEAAVVAVRHSCQDLTAATVAYIRDHLVDIVGTEGWADMMRNHTEDLIRVSKLVTKPPTRTRTNSIAPDMKIKETSARDLASLLDAGDGTMVTLVAGDTQLAAHRAVLAAMSPVFEDMFQHNTLEASSGRVTIPDIEGPVLRQLLAYCYTSNTPRLAHMASQLLTAADKYGLTGLKTECEQQMVADLFLGNVAAAAVLAVRHSCPSLTQAALTFIKAHFVHVVGTKGWADAMRNQPEYLIEVSRLLAEPPPEIRSLTGDEKSKRLFQAAKDGSWEQLRTLIMAGADVGVRDENNLFWTPLHWAAQHGHIEAVRCLLESGAEVDSTGKCQFTPLHTSAFNGHTAVVQLLVASSADPNFKDDYGRTALHLAAKSGRAEVVALLLKVGADKGIRDNEKKSPLDIATENNHQKVIELLT